MYVLLCVCVFVCVCVCVCTFITYLLLPIHTCRPYIYNINYHLIQSVLKIRIPYLIMCVESGAVLYNTCLLTERPSIYICVHMYIYIYIYTYAYIHTYI